MRELTNMNTKAAQKMIMCCARSKRMGTKSSESDIIRFALHVHDSLKEKKKED